MWRSILKYYKTLYGSDLPLVEESEQKVKAEQEVVETTQGLKRRKLTEAPLSLSPIETLHQKILHLQQQPEMGMCSNILRPLVEPQNQEIDKNWLSNTLVEKYVESQIIQSAKQREIALCKLTPMQLTGKSLERFIKRNNTASKIIWPILDQNERHFYLMLIGHENNQVFINCLDGLNRMARSCEFIKKGNELASLLYPESEIIVSRSEHVLRQGNVTDCGVVACYFADHFIQRDISEFETWLQTHPAPLPTVPMPYSPYREQIAQVIYNNLNEQFVKQTEQPPLVAVSTALEPPRK